MPRRVVLIHLKDQPIEGYELLHAVRKCGRPLATNEDGMAVLREAGGEPRRWKDKKIIFLGDARLDSDGDDQWAAVWDPNFFGRSYHLENGELPRPSLGSHFPEFWVAVLA